MDVVGIHLVGGFLGTVFIGFFGRGVGLVFGNGFHQLGIQLIGSLAVLVFSFTLAFIVGWLIERTIGFRIATDAEIAGIDTVVHGEEAYAFGSEKYFR